MAKSKRVSRPKKSKPLIRISLRWLVPKVTRESTAVVLLLVAAITLVSLLFPATLTHDWRDTVLHWFGWSGFVLPILMGTFGFALLWSKIDEEYYIRVQEVTGWILCFLFLLSFGHVLGLVADATNKTMGILGEGLVYLLSFGLGNVGAGLTIFLLGLAGVMLTMNISVVDLWMTIARLWHSTSEYIKERLFPSFKVNRPEAYREPTLLKMPSLPRPAANNNPKPENRSNVVPIPLKPTVKVESPRPQPRPSPGQPWQLPPVSMLAAPAGGGELSQAEIRGKVKLLEDALSDFDVPARVVEVNPGPTVTQFGLEPGFHERYDRNGALLKKEKVKVNEITSLNNDLALALAAPSLRIEAPVPGRAVVGIEIPNASSAMVSLRGVIETTAFQKVKAKSKLAIGLGQDVSGHPTAANLAKMPHLLIAGATGSGKSVCINSIIASLLLHCTPDELRFLMVDPKRVELNGYNSIPHLLAPVVVEVDRAVGVLKRTLTEMEDRYKKFQEAGVRDIEKYNKQGKRESLPYIVVIIDELADLMMVAPEDIEHTLCRLAQLARATGIHLVVATQRPSVDVVTGLIKANIPARISFAVASQVDSRTILDMVGAEKLLGNGDMLYMPPDAAKPHRLQGTYVSDEEIDEIVQFWKAQSPANYVEEFTNATAESLTPEQADDLYDKAVELARQHTHISTSLLQRRLRVGYSRAARLIDMMEEAEIIGPNEGGGKSREVLITNARAELPMTKPDYADHDSEPIGAK